MFFKKLADTTSFLQSALIKHYFQTVRNIQPDPARATAGLAGSLNLNEVALPQTENGETSVTPKETKVASILAEVKAVDGLPTSPSHIQHLVGRATKGRIYQKQGLFPQTERVASLEGSLHDPWKANDKYEVGGIDIAEKTQLILQSPHPVRYVIEKEIYSSQKGLRLRIPNYHTWIMLFGRSLSRQDQYMGDTPYNGLLDNIANASDAGMFSADIHHSIMNIPLDQSSDENCSNQYHMGNKYAVLVGDYFAIRCIYHAERTKTNSVMVAITEGVEEFTTCSFGTNLFDKTVAYPMVLSPSASIHDWILYNQRASGYLKGGLKAALSLHKKQESNSDLDKDVAKFTANLSLFLKAAVEIEALEQSEMLVPSPFLLTSLPAIICQKENPGLFNNLRKVGYELNADHVEELHDIIRRSSMSSNRTRNLICGFASETKHALRRIAKDEYYRHVLDSLIDVVAKEY